MKIWDFRTPGAFTAAPERNLRLLEIELQNSYKFSNTEYVTSKIIHKWVVSHPQLLSPKLCCSALSSHFAYP